MSDELDETILRVLDGAATPEVEASLRARLLADPAACRRFVALSCRQQAIEDALRQRAAEGALPARTRRKVHAWPRRRASLPIAAAAAAIFLVAIGLAVALRPRPAGPERGTAVRTVLPDPAPLPDPSLEEERRRARIEAELAEIEKKSRQVRETPRPVEPALRDEELRRRELELARLEEERKRLEAEKKAPAPPPIPTPAPAPAPVKTTVAEKAVALFREATGTFTLDGRRATLQKKELTVTAGERLRAETVTRLALAENRFLLLAPRATVVFNPTPERMAVTLEEGDLLAELVGPGPSVRVSTKACEAEPLGTVFLISVQGERTTLLVEEGRVDCRGARDRLAVAAGQQVSVAAGRELGAAGEADLKRLSWARAHRPLERLLYQEDFTAPGDWKGEIAGGSARAVPSPGSTAARLHLMSGKPLFQVPLRGRFEIVYRAPQGGDLLVQIHGVDPAQNFDHPVRLAPSAEWRAVPFEFKAFVPTDMNDRTSRLLPGRGIDHLQLIFTPGPKGGGLWIDAIRTVETRP